MKHTFSRNVPYVPEWNGNRSLPPDQQITAVIKPLKVNKLLILMDALGGMRGGTDPNMLGRAEVTKVLKEVGHLLPEHVAITNLEDGDGPVPMEDIIEYPIYMSLATELLMQCATVSMPSEVAEGNSASPPA
jgi:hypothetical protein